MKKYYMVSLVVIIYTFHFINGLLAQSSGRKFKQIACFNIFEAHQGVGVDAKYFYAINNREIGKYDKKTGELAGRWKDKEDGPFIHLDSGVVIDGKLYCAHSNYPSLPMTSSVEIWDTESMKHIGSHSFGINWGSCTWIDRYEGFWWAVFAHYQRYKDILQKDSSWTTLIKFDDDWRALESWVFPDEVLKKFDPSSNSGGSWGQDGLLYCSGHDKAELYILRLPKAGSILELVDIVEINNQGQGISWDRNNQGIIYTIKRKEKQVIVLKLIEIK